ncbi:MAG: molybdopterin-guanine dinucleotide biosynthesis protein [Actinomycetia bacterium]|nr:molybdopterin-guanine dinucleotide biosynthesis protein [Actinomycetes bacterium]
MPAHAHTFDAVVLAGGRGSRLGGADKPALVVGSRTLLASVVSAVTSAGAARVVVVGPGRPALSPGISDPGTGGPGRGARLSYAREEPPGGGPVAALRCGLAEVSAPAIVLAAADLPFLRPAHITRLLGGVASPAGPGAVLLDASGRPQWLVSSWPTALLRGALDRYPGRSLRGLLGPLDPVLLPDETAAGEPPPWLDCDTPGDLRRARDWAARAGSEQEATR